MIQTKLPLPRSDSFDSLDVDWEEIEQRHGRAVRQQFLDGAAEAVLESLRGYLDVLPVTQQEIAEKINVDRSSISHFLRGGGIRLQHFLLLLTEYAIDVSDICPEAERAVAGYMAAMRSVRDAVYGQATDVPLSREGFLSLCFLWANPKWRLAALERDRAQMQEILRDVQRELRVKFGVEAGRLVGLESLQRLMVVWGPCWLICLRLIPQRWAF